MDNKLKSMNAFYKKRTPLETFFMFLCFLLLLFFCCCKESSIFLCLVELYKYIYIYMKSIKQECL